MASRYLLKPLRTLREACRDTALTDHGLLAKDCRSCVLADLCIVNEQIETPLGDSHGGQVHRAPKHQKIH